MTNENYDSTEVLQSFLESRGSWRDGGFYVAYSAIVFADRRPIGFLAIPNMISQYARRCM